MAEKIKCALCTCDGEDVGWVQLGEKGADSVKKAAKMRGEEKDIFPKMKIHQRCRQSYTNSKSIDLCLKRKLQDSFVNVAKKTRKSVGSYRSQDDCLFCCQNINKEKHIGVTASYVKTDAFVSSIHKSCKEQNDEWAQEVNDVTVQFRDGLPVLTVPLPSRHESCEFTLKPITHTVGDMLKFIQEEDGGIDRSAVYTADGSRIAKSTTIDILLRNNFRLSINDQSYEVNPPLTIPRDSEKLEGIADVKNLVSQLYSTLNVEHYQLEREKELIAKLEDLKVQIEPYEKKKQELVEQSNRYTQILTWTGLGLMAVQFGVLARLTWWEYSWDIMEPVTYFVTYGTTIAMYSYFVLSKQEYNFVDVKDRQFLLKFYKGAKKVSLDVETYNRLRNAIALAELDLQRLRDPLQLHLPVKEMEKIKI